MARNHLGSFWNQDTVTAAGLAFAGMIMLQSKLFPALWTVTERSVARLLEWKLVEWWPLLLIAAGVVLWLKHIHENRSRKTEECVTQLGAGSERRHQS
jgi:hypothetical protein